MQTAEVKATLDDRLLDVREVGELLNRSITSIYRDSDSGRMPFGVKFSGARRWRKSELMAWLADGCKPVRQTGGRR